MIYELRCEKCDEINGFDLEEVIETFRYCDRHFTCRHCGYYSEIYQRKSFVFEVIGDVMDHVKDLEELLERNNIK